MKNKFYISDLSIYDCGEWILGGGRSIFQSTIEGWENNFAVIDFS